MPEKDLDVVKALVLLDSKLEAEKLALRAQACQVAEKQRQIRKLITERDKQELAEAEKSLEAWTVKTMDRLTQEGFINEDKLDDHLRRLEAK